MKKFFVIPFILSAALATVGVRANMQEGHSEHHEHKTVIISEDQPVPTISIVVHPDAVRGWNLELVVTNFAFAPEMINQENELNKGHAHLYINGEKITRIYGNWYYLPELPVGENEIKITLNTNQHEDLIYQEQIIEDVVLITN